MRFHTKKLSVLILVLVFAKWSAGIAYSQKHAGSTVRPVHAAQFENGEELLYVAEFSRALLKKLDVAEFRFTAGKGGRLEKVIDSASRGSGDGADYSLKFTGDISSKGFFSKLFNLHFRERIESIVDPTTFTVAKTKRVDEQGKRIRTSESTYANGNVFWIERDPTNTSRTPRTASAPFTGQIHDILSAIYFLRTQPLEVGKTLDVTIGDSGRVYQVPVRVVEKKRLKTVLGRVEAVRVDPDLYGPNRMIAGEGQFSIWFTNDSKRIPVSARIKTDYGTFDIRLRKVIQNPIPREGLTSVTNPN